MYYNHHASAILNAVLETSEEIFVAVSSDFKIVAFTQSFWNYCHKRFGKDAEVGKSVVDVLPWDPIEEDSWKRAFYGESFTLVNGALHQRFSPLHDIKGALKYITDYSVVGEEKKFQMVSQKDNMGRFHEDLRHSDPLHEVVQKRRQNFHILNDSGALAWNLNPEGEYLRNGHSWEKYTGQKFEDCQGWGWIKAHHPEEQELLAKMWHQIGPGVHHFRYCARIWSHKAQEFRYFQVHASLDETHQWHCTSLDVTERKISKRNLKRWMNRLRLALAAANVGTWEWDFQNDILTADGQDYQLFGAHSGAPLAITFEQFLQSIHPDDRFQVEQMSKSCSSEGTPYNVEFRVKWLNGETHWLVGKGKRYFCKEGKPYMLGVNWDITARKEAEQQIVRAMQQQEELRSVKQTAELERQHKVAQEEFIDTVCHEIRNPLVGIYGGVNMAREELDQLKRDIQQCTIAQKEQFHKIITTVIDHLDAIDQCADQQKVIVDDVLDLSKLEARKVELNPSPFRLQCCINTVMQMFSTNIKEKHLYCQTQIPEGDPWLKADLHRLQQVIINLVSNAVKFTNSGGICVRAFVQIDSSTESTLTFQIQDTGIGIPDSELSNIFEKFTQAKRTATKYGGSGLGLAISKRLVETMGGEITAASQQGVGTTFQFTIKCQNVSETEKAEYQASLARAASEENNHVGQKRILIVDDNFMNQKILANYLVKEGHVCRTASNGLEALEMCQHEHFDIVFMDIEMPVMNGMEATRILRQREQGFRQPIIGLSGNARKEKVDAAYQAGMDDYLTKPYKRDDIISAINRALSRSLPRHLNKKIKCL